MRGPPRASGLQSSRTLPAHEAARRLPPHPISLHVCWSAGNSLPCPGCSASFISVPVCIRSQDTLGLFVTVTLSCCDEIGVS